MNDTGRDNRIEAWFLGILGVIVLGVVVFATMTARFGAGAATGNPPLAGTTTSTPSGGYAHTISSSTAQRDIICQCYNNGFELAGKTSNVQSTSYRTGFSQCRSLASVEGGNAWTAGWEARHSGRTYEATCKAYKRRR